MTVPIDATTYARVDGPKTQELVDIWLSDSATHKALTHWRFTRLRFDDYMHIERVTDYKHHGNKLLPPDTDLADAAIEWLRTQLPDWE